MTKQTANSHTQKANFRQKTKASPSTSPTSRRACMFISCRRLWQSDCHTQRLCSSGPPACGAARRLWFKHNLSLHKYTFEDSQDLWLLFMWHWPRINVFHYLLRIANWFVIVELWCSESPLFHVFGFGRSNSRRSRNQTNSEWNERSTDATPQNSPVISES